MEYKINTRFPNMEYKMNTRFPNIEYKINTRFLKVLAMLDIGLHKIYTISRIWYIQDSADLLAILFENKGAEFFVFNSENVLRTNVRSYHVSKQLMHRLLRFQTPFQSYLTGFQCSIVQTLFERTFGTFQDLIVDI